MHVEDLITVERQLGYRYEMQGRRRSITSGSAHAAGGACSALAQGELWQRSADPAG